MSYKSDTVEIIGDSGAHTVFVYRRTSEYSATNKTMPVQTTTIAETATAQYFPFSGGQQGGGFRKDPKGEIKEASHRFYFPYTSSVSVSDQLVLSTVLTEYYEVLRVDPFEDHKRIVTKWVKGRVS